MPYCPTMSANIAVLFVGTEHERLVKEITPDTVVYDVFAGVGPFSVPAAKKGATVICNDLNPMSYESLVHNMKKNKVKGNGHNTRSHVIIVIEHF